MICPHCGKDSAGVFVPFKQKEAQSKATDLRTIHREALRQWPAACAERDRVIEEMEK